jgi:hypothetical protein
MQLHISNDPPTSRAFLEAASLDIGAILQSYIAIHNDIFRFSLRRILPVPVLFQSIDYEDYFRRLFYLDETLGGIFRQFPDHSDEAPELLVIIKRYCEALRAAMSSLRKICGSLMEKAAHQKTYNWTVYQSDLRRYNAAVSRYREIGARLNVLLNG